jgi:Protein of unknown function (DUF1232)
VLKTRYNTIGAIEISVCCSGQNGGREQLSVMSLCGSQRRIHVCSYAKLVAAAVAAYAFSRIDLIPDFVPVLGYLDDIVIVPAGNPTYRAANPCWFNGRVQGRSRDASNSPGAA